jgi:EAL domain-containing protein (putative c-di-GMP-specific phosphodiesterase class I)/FixJ family two-component response regulator
MSTVSAPPAHGDKVAARSAYILDDEPEIGTLVAGALATCGFSARKFTAAAPFLKEFDVAFPGLIVLDLALGQSDAVEIIRRLESLKYKGKILLISGRDEATLAQIAAIGERHGMSMLQPLRKPFRANEIKQRLLGQDVEPQHDAREERLELVRPKKTLIQITEALRRNWLELWYQPKIDLRTLSVCGAEALLRARHPDFGIIDPDHILPPSGDAAFLPLSKFVIEHVLADWVRFVEQGLPVKLSVNVPLSIITSPDFVALIRRILPTDARFPGLVVEVTEDDILSGSRRTWEIASQLNLYNVHISIDRFGTARASRSRLTEMQFSELKIDRGFVSECSSNESRRAVCQTAVDLAHGCGAAACADGVETAADLRTLIELGVDRAQGFLFAEPMPADRLVQRLLAGSARFGTHDS